MSYRLHQRYRVIVTSTSSEEQQKGLKKYQSFDMFPLSPLLSLIFHFLSLPLSLTLSPSFHLEGAIQLPGSAPAALIGSACVYRCKGACVCCVHARAGGEGGCRRTRSQPGSRDRKLCCCPNQRLKAPIAAHEY